MRKHERKPQPYEHRVETVIHAIHELGAAVEQLSLYLEEQMGSEWKEQDHLLKASRKSLARAHMWIKNAMK